METDGSSCSRCSTNCDAVHPRQLDVGDDRVPALAGQELEARSASRPTRPRRLVPRISTTISARISSSSITRMSALEPVALLSRPAKGSDLGCLPAQPSIGRSPASAQRRTLGPGRCPERGRGVIRAVADGDSVLVADFPSRGRPGPRTGGPQNASMLTRRGTHPYLQERPGRDSALIVRSTSSPSSSRRSARTRSIPASTGSPRLGHRGGACADLPAMGPPVLQGACHPGARRIVAVALLRESPAAPTGLRGALPRQPGLGGSQRRAAGGGHHARGDGRRHGGAGHLHRRPDYPRSRAPAHRSPHRCAIAYTSSASSPACAPGARRPRGAGVRPRRHELRRGGHRQRRPGGSSTPTRPAAEMLGRPG